MALHGWLQANLLAHCHCRQSLGRGELACYINADPFRARKLAEEIKAFGSGSFPFQLLIRSGKQIPNRTKSPGEKKRRVTAARCLCMGCWICGHSPARRFHERSRTRSLSHWSEFPGFISSFLVFFLLLLSVEGFGQ